jgi:hypothetical protein
MLSRSMRGEGEGYGVGYLFRIVRLIKSQYGTEASGDLMSPVSRGEDERDADALE